jgi:cytochrome c biogenesis protein
VGAVGWLRWGWRQLTSMRTALILLFLLALAAVPGSLFPQRGVDQAAVREYLADNPELGRVLDRLSMFDVFAAPWFAAIYVLLFISLAGCVLPRAWTHAKAMRARPPAAPRRLDRLAHSRSGVVDESPADVVEAARAHLRGRRFRVAVDEDDASIGAERGYLRETGNLVFHLALLVLLFAVAAGSVFGFRGNVLVREGYGFSNTLTQYDSITPGRFFSSSDLAPFSFTLRDFTATFRTDGNSVGAATSFSSTLEVTDEPGAEPRVVEIGPNKPLVVDGTKVFLVGHGYAPKFTIVDGEGETVFSEAVPFLPQDGAFTSTGVVKVPDALPEQIGLNGIFLPTASLDLERGPISTFPAPRNPAVFLSAWTGDLGLNSGRPQSVYRLVTDDMELIGRESLQPGDSWELPGGVGTVTFDGFVEYATFSVADDPGKWFALGAVVAMIGGVLLSLMIRRRRVWVRATRQDDGRTLVVVGGLGRTEAAPVDDDVAALLDALGVPEEEPVPVASPVMPS